MTDPYLSIMMRLLIAKHGRSNVIAALASSSDSSLELIESELKELEHSQTFRGKTKSGRVLNLEPIVSQSSSPELVRELIALYNNQFFLPTLKHVREFLAFHGHSDKAKSRQDAQRSVVELLASFDKEMLDGLLSGSRIQGQSGEFAALANEIMTGQRRSDRRE